MDSSPPEPLCSPALAFEAVSKRYGGVQALADVSFAVAPGRALGLVGENGAGKSTLVGVASGAVRPDSGAIRVGGVPVTFASPADADRHGIRMAPQELLICPNLTVAENVGLGHLPTRRAGLLDRRALRTMARQRLGELGLEDISVDYRAAGLPVVQQAFVQIARAMTPGARVLIADEPTAAMSAAEADRLLTLLEAIRARGVAVVYVSHRLDEVFRLADDVVVLRDGRRSDGRPAADFDHDGLVAAMTGGVQLAPRRQRRADARGTGSGLEVDGLVTGLLDGVSLKVASGEVVGVYGIAGSGRDELGPATFGATMPRAGQVRVAGRRIQMGRPRASIAAGLGYVPAERRSHGLIPGMTIRENLTLATLDGVTARGILRRREERSVATRWLAGLALAAPSPEVAVSTLSGGTQQKVLLARWLMAQIQALVLDEPTRGVDVATKADIYNLLRDLADRGAAVLVVTSDLEEVVTVSDRVLVLRSGRIAAEFCGATQEQVLQAGMAPTDVVHA